VEAVPRDDHFTVQCDDGRDEQHEPAEGQAQHLAREQPGPPRRLGGIWAHPGDHQQDLRREDRADALGGRLVRGGVAQQRDQRIAGRPQVDEVRDQRLAGPLARHVRQVRQPQIY
jgi:hypothetical protein